MDDKQAIIQALSAWAAQLPQAVRTWVVGFSGGMDSTVLLHACATLLYPQQLCFRCGAKFSSRGRSLCRPELHDCCENSAGNKTEDSNVKGIHEKALPFALRAIHVDHHWQSASSAFSAHCLKLCEQWNIPCQVLDVRSKAAPGQSKEAWAREARYALLSEQVDSQDVFITAHSQNDQAETLLLQLMRGAGLKGLSAMGATKVFGKGTLERPLLACTGEQIEAYAKLHDLSWIEDPSNQETAYLRNFLRHAIMPQLKEKVPGVVQALARSARHIAVAQSLLEDSHVALEKKAICETTHRLDQRVLLDLDPHKQAVILRQWIERVGGKQLSQAKMHTWQQQMLARHDSSPLIQNGESQIRRFKHHWYYLPHSTTPDTYRLIWKGEPEMILPNGVRLAFEPTIGKGLKRYETLIIQCGAGELRCKPSDSAVSKTLKKWWQHYEIPPWRRKAWPLIYRHNSLVMIPSLFVCHEHECLPEEPGLWVWVLD